jgi:hypothetical protein
MRANPTVNNNSNNNYYFTSALGTAIYILKCINEGQSKKEIIYNLDNNEQLVSVWIEYLKHVHWLENDISGNLLASEDGKSWIKKYDESLQQKPLKLLGRMQDNNYLKSQKKIIDSFQSASATFIEPILLYRNNLWNYYYWCIPTSKRIAETYERMANRLVDNAIAASRAANESIFANIKVVRAAMQYSKDNLEEIE